MRIVIWLFIAFALFQNSLGLECYVCDKDECDQDALKTQICGDGTQDGTTTSKIPTSIVSSQSEGTTTTTVTKPMGGETTTLITQSTEEAKTTPVAQPTESTTLNTVTTGAADATTTSTESTVASPTEATTTTAVTKPEGPEGSDVENTSATTEETTSTSLLPLRKRRSIQYYRESNGWKCFTQIDNNSKKKFEKNYNLKTIIT